MGKIILSFPVNKYRALTSKNLLIKIAIFEGQKRADMKYFFIVATLLLSISCTDSRFKVDTSKIKLELPIQRFEQDLFSFDNNDSLQSITSLRNKYGDFYKLYNHQILNIGSSSAPGYTSYLNLFIQNDIYRDVYRECSKRFKDLSKQEEQIQEAFKRYKYFFPNKDIPSIYSYVSGFNTAISVAEGIIGISLENYLGSDHDFYDKLNIYQYKRINMYPDKIPSDCMLGWLLTEFPNKNKKGDLLSEIIYRGAILYLMEVLMPDEPKFRLIGYNEEQYQWAKENEAAIWTYIIENKHLFTTDKRVLKKYIGEAPFTYYFSKESAPQAGVFIGWQIVRSYMKHNREVQIPKLVNITNAQHILEQSRYQP